ncbi:MAG: Fic family protein [bacterium]|nr:Fic family protein [bacterium]
MNRVGFIANFIEQSDLIEGIKNDLDKLKRRIKNNASDGHVGAMLYLERLAKNRKLLTEEDIKKVQELIVAEQEKDPDKSEQLTSEFVGEYRTINVRVAFNIMPDSNDVPKLMSDLINQIRGWQRKSNNLSEIENLAKIADIHYLFEGAHPFADGNGRTGRAIAFYCMLYAEIQPFLFTNHDKHDFYYLPLATKNIHLMRYYFMAKFSNLI